MASHSQQRFSPIQIVCRSQLHCERGRTDLVPFAGGKKEVAIQLILARVQVIIPSPQFVERCMRSALNDPSLFDNKYLIGPANRREPVGNDESCAVLHEGSTTRSG